MKYGFPPTGKPLSINSFGGNYNQADMVKSFITSTEFRSRFIVP
jgi:hypothetical protein